MNAGSRDISNQYNQSRVSWTERITPSGHVETTKTTNQLVRGCKEAMSCQLAISLPANNLQDRKHMFIWKQKQESRVSTLDNAPSEFNYSLTVAAISINLNRLEDYLVCRLCFLVGVFSASVLHQALTFWMCVLSLPFCLIWRKDTLHMYLTM